MLVLHSEIAKILHLPLLFIDPNLKAFNADHEIVRSAPVIGNLQQHATMHCSVCPSVGSLNFPSKQTTFVERGIAQCPPEGGTPIAPSEKALCQVPVAIALDAALPSLETARTFVSSLRSVLPCQRSIPSPRNDCPNRAVS